MHGGRAETAVGTPRPQRANPLRVSDVGRGSLPLLAVGADERLAVPPARLDAGAAGPAGGAPGRPLVGDRRALIGFAGVTVGGSLRLGVGVRRPLRSFRVDVHRAVVSPGVAVGELVEGPVAHTATSGPRVHILRDGHTQVGGDEPWGMAEVDIRTGLYENTVGLVERFLEVATTDPIAAAMLLSGVLLVTISAGVFGVLTLGGLLSPLSGLLPSGRESSRRAR